MSKRRLIISVTDKTGIEKFKQLTDVGWEIISTGGTAKALMDANVPVTLIEKVTGFPEMMNGRVKTLHPLVFGGILAVRDKPAHMEAALEHNIEMIDIVVVNLYDFAGNPDIEQIDIGGPSLIRAAAKNGISTIPLIDPDDYDSVINEVIKTGGITETQREYLVMKVFAQTGRYDTEIWRWMAKQVQAGNHFLTPATVTKH